MKREAFKLLSQDEQETFINSGGAFDLEGQSVECSSSSVASSIPTESVSDATELLVSPTSAQTVPSPSSPSSPSSPLAEVDLSSFGFDIPDPIDLLFLLDDDVSSGRVELHPWQVEFLLDFAKGGINDKHPFQAVVRAANGSGKDKYIVAPCLVWLCMRFKQSRGVVTSSSGVQLDNQTCTYIDQLCNAANRKLKPLIGRDIWKVNYRYYECQFGDGIISIITCFATDEAGKAEGYHPLVYNGKMCLMESEAKTVPDTIDIAMNKCTGYTHRCLVSTPGLPIGHFFEKCTSAVQRTTIDNVNSVLPQDYIHYHITAYDCPHLSKAYIEQMKRDLPGGENSSAFKSQVLAEFGTTDEMVVIPYTFIWKAIRDKERKWKQEFRNTGGLDLSDGGAETALSIRNGNKHLKMIPFRFDNTEDTLDFLEQKFIENDLNHPDALIFADCCGIGKPMLDALKRRGWSNIRYVDSRHKAVNPRVYTNRGTELFFHARLLFEQNEIIMDDDPILARQLSTRYYKINPGNQHQLLSKLEQRSKGYPSPDRADAFNLAFWNYQSPAIAELYQREVAPFTQVTGEKEKGDFNMKSWANRGLKVTPPQTLEQYSQRAKLRDFSQIQKELERYKSTITVNN